MAVPFSCGRRRHGPATALASAAAEGASGRRTIEILRKVLDAEQVVLEERRVFDRVLPDFEPARRCSSSE